jgi:hypothetical protein
MATTQGTVKRAIGALRAVGRRVARVQTTVLLALVYYGALPLFALSKLKDPLRLKEPPAGEGLWRPRAPVEPTIERFKHLF